jgi:hypothetical protein
VEQPKYQPPVEGAATPRKREEDQYRSAIQDAATVLRKLAPICRGVDDMVGLLEFSLVNDATLAMLIERLGALKFRE